MARRDPVRHDPAQIPHQEPRPYDQQHHRHLLDRAKEILIDVTPENWRRIDFKILLLTGACETDLTVVKKNGAFPLLEPPRQLIDLSAELRSMMHRPGRGTWFGMRLMIDPPDTAWVNYNHHFNPLWDPPLPPQAWAQDLAVFPRADEHVPAWLRERLRAGMYAPGLGTWFTATFTLNFPFSYDVHYERDAEPRWQTPPPPAAFGEEHRRFPRDPEHTPDWLGAAAPPRMRVARPFDGTAPDGRPEVRRPEIPDGERDAMVRYLEQAPIVLAARSFDSDVLDPERARNVPLTYHTDGTWVWPGSVGYYLRVHGVPPEPDLAAHIRTAGFRVPEVADDVRSTAAAAITGSS